MCSNTKEFPKVLQELNKSSIHPFCMETYNETRQMHARHFLYPFSGAIEDAVTGTASGAMGEVKMQTIWYIYFTLRISKNPNTKRDTSFSDAMEDFD